MNSVNMLLKYYVFSQNLPLAKNLAFFDSNVFKTTYFAFDTGIYDSDLLRMVFSPEANRVEDVFTKLRRRLALSGLNDCYAYYSRTYTIRSIAGTWSTFCPYPNVNNQS